MQLLNGHALIAPVFNPFPLGCVWQSSEGPAVHCCNPPSRFFPRALGVLLCPADHAAKPCLCCLQVLAYYWQLYLQNALQQSGGALPMPFLGAPPFMSPDALAGQYQQQAAAQAAYNGGRGSADGNRKRSRDGDGGSTRKGRRARNENKVRCTGGLAPWLHVFLMPSCGATHHRTWTDSPSGFWA